MHDAPAPSAALTRYLAEVCKPAGHTCALGSRQLVLCLLAHAGAPTSTTSTTAE